ncbi:MAG: NACHT domain-containing protein, partial [Cyanobacteria bacterium J06632_3]
MTQPQHEPPSKVDEFVENARKLLIPGGATAGVAGAFWSLFGAAESDFTKAAMSAGVGLALSIGSYLLGPIASSTKRRAKHAGEKFDEVTEQVIAAATGFEEKYLRCQASDCESVRAEGMAQREGIFEPLLKDVFVELQIDSAARLPGLAAKASRRLDIEGICKQTIWDFLADSRREQAFRQLAILAWGGYGKTTLLKHVAYRYGVGNVPKGAPKLVPVLVVLRKYRAVLAAESPPDLSEFIVQQHMPNLPEAHRLEQVPPNWAKGLLQKGRALVMFDGFDEVPREERPAVAKWINEQMRAYRQSVFVVTSRPKAYKEQNFADRLVLDTPMWVQPFDDVQRRKFVESWYLSQEKLKARRDTPEVRKVASSGAQDLLQQIEAETELKDLAKNPLLLNMIATFHRLYPGAALPKRRVDLYGEICDLQLKARPRDRRLDTVLLEFEPQPVLEQIAFGMMQRVVKRIDGDALLQEMTQALTVQDETVDAAELLRDVVQISELIVQQEDEYEFAHLSFQEYLVAAYVAAKPDAREGVLYEHLKEDWWKATILLYAGKTKKPSLLIREVIRQGNNDLAYACLQQTTKRVDDELRA